MLPQNTQAQMLGHKAGEAKWWVKQKRKQKQQHNVNEQTYIYFNCQHKQRCIIDLTEINLNMLRHFCVVVVVAALR